MQQIVAAQFGDELTSHRLRVVAVRAACDERTVRRLLDGQRVRKHSERRIVRALDDLGFRVGT